MEQKVPDSLFYHKGALSVQSIQGMHCGVHYQQMQGAVGIQ
jgi:hypothetical protein